MHALVRWFAQNPVAANLLMLFIVVSGLFTLNSRVPLEVFPSFEFDSVSVQVTWRGATPAEVEDALVMPIEAAIEDVVGIEEVESTATEGRATLRISVERGQDAEMVRDEISQRIEQLSNLPEDADNASVYIPTRNRDVISVVVSGALAEQELRDIATRVRDDLQSLPEVSSVELSGARDRELEIEVSQVMLERHGLALSDIVDAINANSLDLSGGSIQTGGGEVLLRTSGKAYSAEDYQNIVVLSQMDGTRLRLGEVATITDGFGEDQLDQRFNGMPSIEIDVYRTGMQSAIAVADAVKAYVAAEQTRLPAGLRLDYWRDDSRAVKARINTLLDSALLGGVLVLLLLTLFLRFSVAFWVFVGVPVSMLGGIALMPLFGVTLNMLSLFAFILVLGIVVDDAIVTGENIYARMRHEPDSLKAAIEGTNEVAIPVTFGVLTTVAAFTPLLMIEGVRGQLFAQIPLIVIPVLLFSIVESKFVLPSHLAHLNFHDKSTRNPLARLQYRIADGFEWFVEHLYQPMLGSSIRWRYSVLAGFIAVSLVVYALVSSGQVRFVFFPRVQSEVARASLTMPEGTPFEVTAKHINHIADAVKRLQEKYTDPESGRSVVENLMATAGQDGQSHSGRVMFEIVPPEERTVDVSSSELVREWQQLVGAVPGSTSLSYRAEFGRGGSPIDVQLSAPEFDALRTAASHFRAALQSYPGVTEISDTLDNGKQEITLSLTPAGEQFGLDLALLGQQVRRAFLGEQVQSFQRNRDEVTVVVRYPESERQSLAHLERLPIALPGAGGQTVPLQSVAVISLGQGFSSIRRLDYRRVINVQADVDKSSADIEGIKAAMLELGAELSALDPDLRVSLEGEAAEQRESFRSLRNGLMFVLLVIYTLLAIPFRSYLQPLMVMLVIPFGIVGAILGHMIMRIDLSIMSYMGMLALCGVVVNDSLVLVDYVNRRRREGMALDHAVRRAGVARFRAVILTSLTTFFGLVPLIFETSTQAQFLVPMAVSLGFGILFATFVTLLFIPVMYVVFHEIGEVLLRLDRRLGRRSSRIASA